jgi:hypothetical protein
MLHHGSSSLSVVKNHIQTTTETTGWAPKKTTTETTAWAPNRNYRMGPQKLQDGPPKKDISVSTILWFMEVYARYNKLYKNLINTSYII